MLTTLVPTSDETISSNRLQTHKSSFQAWKCVSFGCSLLAIVLLLSKWHEVCTDLQLLLGIDQLLSQPHSNSSGANWPPLPLELLLPAPNETNFGLDSMESNNSMLMSHLQISLGREHVGNQLLRQEVETFVSEYSFPSYTNSWIVILNNPLTNNP